MKQQHSIIDTIDQIVTDGIRRGLLHLYTDGNNVNGNILTLKNRQVVNFGSCSYLGLEFDARLTNGAIEAIQNYGTQFAESRAYVSIKPYERLESMLEMVFGLPVVVTPTTTLGHISNIPVIVGDKDAIIMDHQVHQSVQTAVNLVKVRGVHTELVRHNRMDLLEKRIRDLRGKYKRIWYMADGIYSMYGDKCPVQEVKRLLDTYPEFFFYADDAHGMSIYGDRGQGYILSQLPYHERMYLATSLNKAFASGGGALIFPNPEMKQRVRACGGPLITSGPLQPANLGAGIAAAGIHLGSDIGEMQETLHDNIQFANLLLQKFRLPVVSVSDAAVFFIGVSLPGLGYNLVKRMLNRGFYLNLGIFPAVPIKNTGIRFTITRLHGFTQIEQMIAALAEELPLAMKEEGISEEAIYRAFRLPMPDEAMSEKKATQAINQALQLQMDCFTSASELDPIEWNSLFEGKGNFDFQGVCFLERTFTANSAPENNWQFDYIIVRDNENQPVAATFLTTALCKDDMLSPAPVSKHIEQLRFDNPYYLTSRTISTGCLFSEGSHLYINRQSPFWKEALQLIFEKITQLQETHEANTVLLRDFNGEDEELNVFLMDNGFFRLAMPETNVFDLSVWQNRDEYIAGLSPRSRKHFRQDIIRYEDEYQVRNAQNPGKEEIIHWYQLYCNVKNRNFELNTFSLPYKLFEGIATSPGWDILTLHLKNKPGQPCVGVIMSYQSGDAYASMMIGMDYDYLNDYQLYKQCLYRMVTRAKQRGCNRVFSGFSANFEKRKLGATQVPVYSFVQVKDDYNLKEIDNIAFSRLNNE
jgi:7-keto-8-aminopelargonate synthetase-like enzyme